MVLWGVAAGFGVCMASIFPTALNVAGTVIDVDGKYVTVMVMGASFGEFLLPALAGVLFDRTGPSSLPVFVLVVAVVQSIAFFFLILCVRRFEVDSPAMGSEVEFEKLDGSSSLEQEKDLGSEPMVEMDMETAQLT